MTCITSAGSGSVIVSLLKERHFGSGAVDVVSLSARELQFEAPDHRAVLINTNLPALSRALAFRPGQLAIV
eukprot:6693011-Pyramimonas_sp.AAC.1